MVITKRIVATLLSVAIFISLVCFTAYAIDIPTVTVGEQLTVVTFVNGDVKRFPNPVDVHVSDTGVVYVKSDTPMSAYYNRDYVAFNKYGEYLAVQSNLNDPSYTAFNDEFLWYHCPLNVNKVSTVNLEVLTNYVGPLTSEGQEVYQDLNTFFVTDATEYYGEYGGLNYTRWDWAIGQDINFGNVTDPPSVRNFLYAKFNIRMRFDNLSDAINKGYNRVRLVDLLMNFSGGHNNNGYYVPYDLYDFRIEVQSPLGESYELFYDDYFDRDEYYQDIQIHQDTDFYWDGGSYITASFEIWPSKDELTGNPNNFEIRMFCYDKGEIALSSNYITDFFNTQMVQTRLAEKIVLENDVLDRFKDKLIDDGVISLETGYENGINNLDVAPITEIFSPRGKVKTIVSLLMFVSCSIALIGFALVGKKG